MTASHLLGKWFTWASNRWGEDVAQLTLIRAWQRGRGTISWKFLTVTAARIAIDQHREHKRHAGTSAQLDSIPAPEPPQPIDLSPLQHVDAADLQHATEYLACRGQRTNAQMIRMSRIRSKYRGTACH